MSCKGELCGCQWTQASCCAIPDDFTACDNDRNDLLNMASRRPVGIENEDPTADTNCWAQVALRLGRGRMTNVFPVFGLDLTWLRIRHNRAATLPHRNRVHE